MHLLLRGCSPVLKAASDVLPALGRQVKAGNPSLSRFPAPAGKQLLAALWSVGWVKPAELFLEQGG